MSLSYYPSNPSFNEAAVLLDMMSADQMRKVVELISSRGASVIVEIKGRDRHSGGGISPLAILDSKFVPSDTLEHVAIGLNTLLLGALRKPLVGTTGYKDILMAAFNLEAGIAEKIANKIETRDVLGTSYDDKTGIKQNFIKKWALSIVQFANDLANEIPGVKTLGLEIDYTQEYDLDFLYELKLLGAEVVELNQRAALMSAQAQIFTQKALFQGDVEGLGDADYGDLELGDTIRMASARNMPNLLFTSLSNVKTMGDKNKARARHKIKSIASGNTTSPQLKSSLRNVLKGNVGKALLMGTGIGLAPMAIRGLINLASKSKSGSGDIDYGDIHQSLSDAYGDVVADRWAEGDIEGMMGEIERDGSVHETTGDADLDGDIEDAVGDLMVGDIDELGPQLGGLFMRARINAQKRKKRRRTRRAKNRARLTRSRREADEVEMDPDDEPEPDPEPAPRNRRRPPMCPRPQNEDFDGSGDDQDSSNDEEDGDPFQIGDVSF